MNRQELENYAGTFALVVLVVMAFLSWYLQRPITDRTLAIFGIVLWTTLQLDISALLPFNIVPIDHSEDNSGEGE